MDTAGKRLESQGAGPPQASRSKSAIEDSELKDKRLRVQRRLSNPEDKTLTDGNQTDTVDSRLTTGMESIQSTLTSASGTTDKKSPKLLPLIFQKGATVDREPGKIEGYLLKKRKRPMKGWHKRYFVLEKGMLTYGKSPGELMRGKISGTIDVGFAVVSTEVESDQKSKRIDLDTEEFLYHVKATSYEAFKAWRGCIQQHQQFRQQIINAPLLPDDPLSSGVGSPTSEVTLKAMTLERRRQSLRKQHSKFRASTMSSPWMTAERRTESSDLDKIDTELADAENNIVSLSNVLQDLLNQELPPYADGFFEPEKPVGSGSSNPGSHQGSNEDLSFGGAAKKKGAEEASGTQKRSSTRKILRRTRHKKNNSDTTIDITKPQRPASIASMTNVANPAEDAATSATPVDPDKYRDEFLNLSSKVQNSLKSVLHTLTQQSEQLRLVMNTQAAVGGLTPSRQVIALQEALNKAKAQNDDMRSRMGQIFDLANIGSLSPVPSDVEINMQSFPATPDFNEDRGAMSRSESYMEFYDAQEYLPSSPSSSEDEFDEEEIESKSTTSDETEMIEQDFRELEEFVGEDSTARSQTGRRTCLPAPQPDTSHLSLWNILKKNIGKDLSKIAMPVALNEPLSMLQVLCEELEYSELLDKAAETEDPYKRMVFVAAFAVSSYSSTYTRAGTKPFNPLLGETYECVREDKGFRFIAEQVSHHPPVSVCHCTSKNFIYRQEIRIKTKFWGKSMELIPTGNIHIEIPRYGDHYQYSKVTSCVHNILSGERWLDHYGETLINNGRIMCKLTFTKASYWSNHRHEITGQVLDEEGHLVHELFGKWNEGVFCGRSSSAKSIWRTALIPENHRMYYGFTRFAIELNELDPTMQHLLASTDSRFRPDQRFLEEGDLLGAEKEKQRVESLQRERRKAREEQGITYEPRFFKCVTDNSKESWEFLDDYWLLRKDPGFKNLTIQQLW
ncbi:oxysterol-binding protein-related protein 6-like isoform X2 [Amphiura filiformis]|uniref:oxysterol-binding protein-related protein 6-like isoform X2 n=1 Tax=Amphiura filiformis TaxID=82378 RepID=UPI003B2277FC